MKYPEINLRGQRAWVDDANVPMRLVVRRDANRFQAYQKLDGEYLSMGYFLTRDTIRPFLNGQAVELVSEFGENTEAEPIKILSLDAYLEDQ